MNRSIVLFFLFCLLGSTVLLAQTNKPDWEVNPSDFEFGMDITIQVFFNDAEINTGGMIGAFIDGNLQGVKVGGAIGPTGKFVFITRVFGNDANGKTITFKFYDELKDRVYVISETENFIPDGIIGDAVNPRMFHCVLNSDATLTSIEVNGIPVSDFNPNQTVYSYALTAGTVALPVVSVTARDGFAAVMLAQPTTLPGSAIAEVTAEDGITKLTYIVNFTVTKNDVATLSEILVGDSVLNNFDPQRFSYEVQLPHTTTTVPIVSATTMDSNAQIVIIHAPSLPGITTIIVTAEDGVTTLTYTVDFSLAPNNDAELSDLMLDGTTITGFSRSTFSYHIELPFGTTRVPVVTVITSDANATALISPATALPGTTTILVTAEDGYTGLSYSVEFAVGAASSDADLADLTINGVTIAGFDPTIVFYEEVLPVGTAVVPLVAALTKDGGATVLVDPALSVPGITHAIVTAQDGISKKTYSVSFLLEKNDDASLADIWVSGSEIEGFDGSVFEYFVELPFGATAIPIVTALPSDNLASCLIIPAEFLPGITSILVTAEDGVTTKMYTVSFLLAAASSDATLSDLNLDGLTIPGFSPSVLYYQVDLPAGTQNAPVLNATANHVGAVLKFNPASSVPGRSVVNVIAEDGITGNDYVVDFTLESSAVCMDHLGLILSIYPNPSKGQFNLFLSRTQFAGQSAYVIITDVMGRTIMNHAINFCTNEILIPLDISFAQPGLYFVHVKDGAEWKVRTMLKE